MGIPGDDGNLAGQFFAGLYVFQSLLVARIVRVFGGFVPLVLGPHADAQDAHPMGHSRADGRPDG